MTKIIKTILAAAIVAAPAMVAGGAHAQVAGGIASADPLIAIAKTKALGAGFNQINTSYAAYYTQMDAKSNEIVALQKQLDTNKDNQLSEAEIEAAQKAKNPAIATIQAKQAELNKLQEPIVLAQYFVIEGVTAQYDAALQTVVTAKKLSMVLSPEAIIYSTPAGNITQDVTGALDARVPSVAVTPPANWRPTSRQTVQLHQQIMQLLQASAQQAAAQKTPAATPPATQPQSR
jgi:Skp family chaperone for outer membrane proteins